MNATHKGVFALLLPALLSFLPVSPATALDGDRADDSSQWNQPDRIARSDVLPDRYRLDPSRFPGRPVDSRWIDQLNAYSSGAAPDTPRALPTLPWQNPAVAPVPGWPRAAADFEPQQALLLPVGILADEAPEVLTGLVAATRHRVAIVGLVSDDAQRLRVEQKLEEAGLQTEHIQFVQLPHNTKWLRDYGPVFVWMRNHRRAAVDAEYPEQGRDDDDAMPEKIAQRFHANLLSAPIVFEGGNLLSNGQGLCLTTTAAVIRNSDQSDAESRVCRAFRKCFGSTRTVFLEPLMGERTGHVDMFACFAAPDVVLLGAYKPADDMQNAALLDRNAARLAGISTPVGPLRVIRIPMPPHHDGNWRTYTNVIFANGTVLMPTYLGVDREGREQAQQILAQWMSGWNVVGIDCTRLIRGGGALRCVSTTVPLAADNSPSQPRISGTPQGALGNSRIDHHGRSPAEGQAE